jgi:hypothetical protein
MVPETGWTLIGLAVTAIAVVWFGLRRRVPAALADTVSALAGACLGVGGLLVLEDPGVASWVVTPPFLAVVAVLHRRFLFAGDGPLRT